MLYIDSDSLNGNGQQFQNVVKLYNECRKKYRIMESPIPGFFRPEIDLHIEDPVQQYRYFRDLTVPSRNNVKEANGAEALMKALYSEEEREMKITDGFFAHPNVGAAVFAANMDRLMGKLVDRIKTRDIGARKKVRIFMLGSLFGGTGASSLPTISNYLKRELYGNSDDRLIDEKVKIGGCMILPYFLFSYKHMDEKEERGEDIPIEGNKFATKTRSALGYYKYVDEKQKSGAFDSLYILGHDGGDVRGYYETAGIEQRNLPHIVEFYGAMAAVSFFESDMEERGRYFAVVGKKQIGWSDFYKNTSGFFLFFIMMRFAIVMKSLILEEMFDYRRENKLKATAGDIPWYYDFLNGKDKSADMQPDQLYHKFESMAGYCDEYIRWFAELHIANIERLKSLDEIRFDAPRGARGQAEELDGEQDIVDYLQLFMPEMLVRQFHNDLVSVGRGCEKDEEKNDAVYQRNVKWIRNNFTKLVKTHTFSNLNTEKIGMDEIWSRICDLGFEHTAKKENLVENLATAKDKSMDACVRNLVNAVYIACMI